MRTTLVTRRRFIACTAALGGSTAIGCTSDRPGIQAAGTTPLVLRCFPFRVFKAADAGHEDTESWTLNLVLEATEPGPWVSRELEITLRTGASVVGRTSVEGSGLAAIRSELQTAIAPGRATCFPFTVRVRGTAPRAVKVDSIECTLQLDDPAGVARSVAARIPFEGYEQRTKLLFPFRGHGMISQGGANNGGHRNRSGQFAVDAIGLTPMYAPQLGAGDGNEAAAGWGREILAPAAGVVARVRSDRPDQPVTGKSDPEFLLPEFREGGDPGNHVVIDHENGEFSMLAHFQSESLAVSAGQRVESGEPIGLLGNSGDSTFPHVHYQLMDGVEWQACDALPYAFVNMPARLFLGTWFEAKG